MGQERKRQRRDPDDVALAMMVYLTWMGTGAPLPSVDLQKWCNEQLGHQAFPERESEEGGLKAIVRAEPGYSVGRMSYAILSPFVLITLDAERNDPQWLCLNREQALSLLDWLTGYKDIIRTMEPYDYAADPRGVWKQPRADDFLTDIG